MESPRSRIWDPETHKVWNLREPDFDESVKGGWWRKPIEVKGNVGDDEVDLQFERLAENDVKEIQGGRRVVPPTIDEGDGEVIDTAANGGGVMSHVEEEGLE